MDEALTTFPSIDPSRYYRAREAAREFDRRAALMAFIISMLVAALPGAYFQAPMLLGLAGLSMGGIIALEPRVGLYLSIAIVGIDAAPFDPLTKAFGDIFNALPGMKMTPVEMLIIWTMITALARGIVDTQPLRLPDKGLMVGAGALFFMLALAVVNGVLNGGDFTIAFWEVRAMLIILPMMIVTTLLVHDRRDLLRLGVVSLATLLLMTLETFYRYMTIIRTQAYNGPTDFAYAHETSLLVGLLMVGCVAWAMWGPNRKQRLIALGIAIFATVVLMSMRRRAGLIGGEAGVIALGLFLLLKNWQAFIKVAPVVLVFTALYMGVFWNNANTFGQPVRAFRAVVSPAEVSERDRASDDYRIAEGKNIWANIRAKPVEGLGFGVKYAMPFKMVDISSFWPFYHYISHNTILWLWMKAGVGTFLVFWWFIGTTLSAVVRTVKNANEPMTIVASTIVGAFVPMLILFSYVDLGLTSTRLMIVFGVSLGTVSVLNRLAAAESAAEVETSAAQGA